MSSNRFQQGQRQFSREDLEYIGQNGFHDMKLPLDPLLMLDRVTNVDLRGPNDEFKIIGEAEKDIDPETWFFKAHFKGDPVMPGCLMVEGIWQLFSICMASYIMSPENNSVFCPNSFSRSRVMTGLTKFSNQVLGDAGVITYKAYIKRMITKKMNKDGKEFLINIGVGDGELFRGEELSCAVSGIMVRMGPIFDEDFRF